MYTDTILRYHLGVNPDELSDQEWAITFKQLADIREREAKTNTNNG